MAKLAKSSIVTPIILIGIYIVVTIVLRMIFPSGKALIDELSKIYGKYGYEIVISGSFLESLLLINLFTPGVAAIGLGVVFARAGRMDLSLVIISAVVGSIVGYSLDYWVGRFGIGEILDKIGQRETMAKWESRLEHSYLKTFSLGFIHPDIGAFVSLTAGTLDMAFRKFLALAFLSTLVWYSIWGLAIFALGRIFLVILSKYVFVLVLVIGAILVLTSIWDKKE